MIAYYGFKKMPFAKSIKADQLFESYDFREAMARLNHIKQHPGILLLTGEPGSGKTVTLRHFVDRLSPQNFIHCYSPHSTVSRNELYKQLNTILGLKSKFFKSALFNQFQNAIVDLREHHGKIPVIILDEAHLMENQALQELILLSNFEMDSKTQFILILTGQPVLKDRLKMTMHEPLNQRISLRYHMAGMDEAETEGYICHHLKLVGRTDQLFEPQSYKTIAQLSFGLPRKIENICLAAMTLTMLEKKMCISAETVLQASRGL